MTDFCIQIHPDRADDLDLGVVRAVCDGLTQHGDLIRKFAVVEGEDGRRYVNLMFATERPKALWEALRRDLYEDDDLGDPMRRSSMAMCEGAHGWDDYLLLHHYDPQVPVAASP